MTLAIIFRSFVDNNTRPSNCLKHQVVLLLLTGEGKLNPAQILRKLANQLTSWHEKDDENAIVRMKIPN